MRIEPTEATLGATVTGVDLAALDDELWAAIEDAFLAHAVLIFPGQHLSDGDQLAFGRRFGELSIETMVISNLDDDGAPLPPGADMVRLLRGNEGWHTDSSFQPLSARVSILSARVVPAEGGETEWADMRAAYDALDPPLRARVEGLSAHHSLVHSQGRTGQEGGSLDRALGSLSGRVGGRATMTGADPLRPLVKVHSETGRPALFIGRHAYGIPGLSPEESELLLDELIDIACRPPRVLRHRWQPGDLVAWDNRSVLHRARPYDPAAARVMVHTRVGGDPVHERGR